MSGIERLNGLFLLAYEKDGEAKLARMRNATYEAVQSSFGQDRHPMQRITREEVKRRAEILIGWIGTLVNDGWHTERIMAALDECLDSMLRRGSWTPPRIH